MKIKITTKYNIGHRVWTIDYEDMECYRWIVSAIIYYGENDYEYELSDDGCYITKPEELIYRTKTEAKDVLKGGYKCK